MAETKMKSKAATYGDANGGGVIVSIDEEDMIKASKHFFNLFYIVLENRKES